MRRISQVAALLLFLARAALGRGSIQVAFAGLPRSGTKSLSQAIKRLGYKTCHGTDLMQPSGMTEGARAILEAFADGNIDDALRLTEEENCEAVFDLHSWWWRHIRRKRPNAKFIIVIRDYDKWEASMQKAAAIVQPMVRYPLRWLSLFDLLTRVLIGAAQAAEGGIGLKDADEALDYYLHPSAEKYVQGRKGVYDRMVRDGLDFAKKEPKRALFFNLKDGYPPLCKFLGIPDDKCPDEDIPHANSGIELTITTFGFIIIELSFFAIPVLLVLFVVRKWWCKSAAMDDKSAPAAAAANKKDK